MDYRQSKRRDSFESDQSSSQAGLLSEKQFSTVAATRSSWITPRVLSDFTIGLSDGLTVPFALTAGLSALGDGKIVVSAGLAELVAGAMSMGVAGYLGAKGERDAQITSSQATKTMIAEPEEAVATIRARFENLALPTEILDSITAYYSQAPSGDLLQTLSQFDEYECESQAIRPWLTGTTIATAYFSGGFIPLLPYLFGTVDTAFVTSIVITAFVLFTFGCVKVPLSGCGKDLRKCLNSGLEMLVLGGLAAAAALICVKVLNGSRSV